MPAAGRKSEARSSKHVLSEVEWILNEEVIVCETNPICRRFHTNEPDLMRQAATLRIKYDFVSSRLCDEIAKQTQFLER